MHVSFSGIPIHVYLHCSNNSNSQHLFSFHTLLERDRAGEALTQIAHSSDVPVCRWSCFRRMLGHRRRLSLCSRGPRSLAHFGVLWHFSRVECSCGASDGIQCSSCCHRAAFISILGKWAFRMCVPTIVFTLDCGIASYLGECYSRLRLAVMAIKHHQDTWSVTHGVRCCT